MPELCALPRQVAKCDRAKHLRHRVSVAPLLFLFPVFVACMNRRQLEFLEHRQKKSSIQRGRENSLSIDIKAEAPEKLSKDSSDRLPN